MNLNEPYITRDGSVATLDREHNGQYIGYVKLNPEEYTHVVAAMISRWNKDGKNVYNTEFDIVV